MPSSVPNPTGTKYVVLNDLAGGQAFNAIGTIDANGNFQFTDVLLSALSLASGTIPGEQLLVSKALVDLNAAPENQLYTVPTGKSCYITRVVLRKASTSLTTASIAFGFNAGTDNDVIATATHTELTGNTLVTVLVPKVGAKVGVAGGVFSEIATILQGGAATCTIDVFGVLF